MQGFDLLTKWHRAIELENIKILEDMVHRLAFPIDALCDPELTGLFIAILENKNLSSSFLIEQGANLQFQNSRGLTPLMLCVLRRNTLICETMIAKGANVFTTDENGQNALFYAIQNNHEDIVKLFLEKGCFEIHPHYHYCRDLLKRTQRPIFSLLFSYYDRFDPVCQKALKAERMRHIFI